MASSSVSQRIRIPLLYVLATLLSFTLIQSTVVALPFPRNELFRFDISAPSLDTQWLVDSFATIAWDADAMPEKSTLDITLMQHAKKRAILLRRYVPAQQGSIQINLGPEIEPGTYSLLLTVYKGRSSTVVGRSLVPSIVIAEESEQAIEAIGESPSDIQLPSRALDQLYFKKELQDAVLDEEGVQLNHESSGKTMVLMAPYTIGWNIPKALEKVPDTLVNILLVSEEERPDGSIESKVQRVLAGNIDARAGFQFVFLPKDTPRGLRYRIRVVIYGNGRKFIGHTRQFATEIPVIAMGL
ncbi:hypothetical protein B0O80DRAFT_450745 [Mortierella sp. GBAus27b]|nr:hypothetical protein BGX31_006498 [Mortierella sp. GBA43]KAI8354305.1 hypothetical protein B0O80DRAFT_450745 [Mortierella sp. GBAus27b]